jgi:IclR family acetate operon transcriptional repressor
MSNEPYPGTQAVRRAVSILKAFTDEQPEWGLTELARAVKLNKTTVYRLLSALEGEGFIARNLQTEAYRLGPEAIALGARAQRSNDLRTASHAELEWLAEATQETATLEVFADGQMLILDEAHGPHVMGNVQSIGTRWPAHATSTGKVLLAHLPDEELKTALRAGLTRLNSNTIASQEALRRELKQVKEQGYAMTLEDLEVGLIAVGAPVRNHEGVVVGAVSVGGPSLRLTEARRPDVARQVMKAAGRISERLGYREK